MSPTPVDPIRLDSLNGLSQTGGFALGPEEPAKPLSQPYRRPQR